MWTRMTARSEASLETHLPPRDPPHPRHHGGTPPGGPMTRLMGGRDPWKTPICSLPWRARVRPTHRAQGEQQQQDPVAQRKCLNKPLPIQQKRVTTPDRPTTQANNKGKDPQRKPFGLPFGRARPCPPQMKHHGKPNNLTTVQLQPHCPRETSAPRHQQQQQQQPQRSNPSTHSPRGPGTPKTTHPRGGREGKGKQRPKARHRKKPCPKGQSNPKGTHPASSGRQQGPGQRRCKWCRKDRQCGRENGKCNMPCTAWRRSMRCGGCSKDTPHTSTLLAGGLNGAKTSEMPL